MDECKACHITIHGSKGDMSVDLCALIGHCEC